MKREVGLKKRKDERARKVREGRLELGVRWRC